MFSGQRKFGCIDKLLSKKDTKDSAKGDKIGGEVEKRVLDRKLWRINKMKNITDFEDLLKDKYGEKGSPSRDKYDADSLAFRIGVMLKEARKEAHITQEELAERTGTKKSYISRIEQGQSDIQISTYYKLIELGLGKHLNISIG